MTDSLIRQRSLDMWCDSFESDWLTGQPDLADAVASITEQQLADAGVTRREVLEELIKIDLEYRWRRASESAQLERCDKEETVNRSRSGTLPKPHKLEFYLEQFPELSSDGRISDELIAEEYRVRSRWGDRPHRAEFIERFSSQRESLKAYLDRIDVQLREVATATFPSQLRCPNCHTTLSANDEGTATQIACPKCGQEIHLVDPFPNGTGVMTDAPTLGHFELLERLGSGTFGVVWKARDLKLDRIVAVKVARQTQLAERDTFLREARAAAQLKHPNIVSVYEARQDGETVYLVCDYVAGTTLDEWAKERQPTFRESAQLCMKIAAALEHAHRAGVIHRDLKPGNIMMDADDEPHLMDFGLARREAGEVTMTVEGQILGTPAYMSPEQAKGEGHVADRRTDVYSLGVTFYELLTGVRPFQGNVRMLLKQVMEDEPRSPATFVDGLPRDLETICLKCLEKHPAQRFGSAGQLVNELDRFVRGEAIASRPISRFERGLRWCRRKPLVAISGLLSLLLLGASLTAGYQGLLAVESRQETLRARVDALWQTEFSSVPAVIESLGNSTPQLQRQLKTALAEAETEGQQDRVLRAKLALMLKGDAGQIGDISALLRTCELDKVSIVVRCLAPYGDEGLAETYWSELADPEDRNGPEFLRLSAALVSWQNKPDRWSDELIAPLVVELLDQPEVDIIAHYRHLFGPLGPRLAQALCQTYGATGDDDTRDKIIYLVEYSLVDANKESADSMPPQDLAALAGHVEARHYPSLRRIARDHYADSTEELVEATKQQVATLLTDPNANMATANAVAFLVDIGGPDYLWDHLRLTAHPEVRSRLIQMLRSDLVSSGELHVGFSHNSDISIRRAILLTLGNYPSSHITSDTKALVKKLYLSDPDPGIHGAALWALQRWDMRAPVLRASSPGKARPGWFVNGQQQVMVMLPAGSFSMGSPPEETGRRSREGIQQATIVADFAISATEITVEELQRFEAGHEYDHHWAPTKSCPVGRVTLQLAARYCNWLSAQDGLPISEWCFPTDPKADIRVDYEATEYLRRKGYRLPTSAEWEYACRAGTLSKRYFGECDSLLDLHAWYAKNSEAISHPVAMLMPNDWGLFDLYGNARERTIDTTTIQGTLADIVRGETAQDYPIDLRSAFFNAVSPKLTNSALGFRVARTLRHPTPIP